jgi:hypothetical protein
MGIICIDILLAAHTGYGLVAVVLASVPSKALVLVIAVKMTALFAPTSGVCVNTGVAVTAMFKILQN